MTAQAEPAAEIIAKPGSYYRNSRFIIVALLIGMGGFFLYDGYVRYPGHNVRYKQATDEMAVARAANDSEAIKRLDAEFKDLTQHTDTDIVLQKRLGYILPPLGVAFLIWTLYSSRGVYRFANNTLHVPGHPPIPLDAMTRIDQRKWDRKGIALIDYELPDRKGTVKIDDFIYERKPTDAIYKQITDKLLPASEPASNA